MDLKIETGVPIPRAKPATPGKWDFIREMKDDESFYVPTIQASRTALKRLQDRYRKENIRLVIRAENNGHRVWKQSM